MRIIGIIMTLFFLHISGITNAQITLNESKGSLQKILKSISKQTGYDVIYSIDDLRDARPVQIKVKNSSLEKVLEICFKNQPLIYTVANNTIMIKRPSVVEAIEGGKGLDRFHDVIGKVVDEEGKPLGGATVTLQSTNLSVTTNYKGEFFFKNVPISATLIVSYLGHVSKGYVCSENGKHAHIILARMENKIEDVVVNTGMFERKKDTFTGVTRSFSGDELRNASRQNILEGLNMLDPSFKIIRDNNLGSDPNQLPKVEMRGSRSVPLPTNETYSQQLKLEYENDPNQPLFILDGFETSLANIVNLDVNRIASLTLLKDAASTALYGSRSANGVVVVETIRPKAGDLRFSYSSTLSVSMPDLSSYNLMNSAELLKFQELTSEGPNGPFAINLELGRNWAVPELKHAFRKNAVLNGIDSDWKNVPLQTATVWNHALSVIGGDNHFSYTVGLNTGSNIGVMIGSENSRIAGFANLSYRKGKFNISNNLNISGDNKQGSPYGNFSDYVKTPTYYVVNNTNRYLEEHHGEYYNFRGELDTRDYYFANPIYNALLPHKNIVKGHTISNNLMANWDVFSFLRVSSGIQYSKSVDQSDFFMSPLHTMFDGKEETERGSYDYNNANSESFKYFLGGNFRRVLAEKHIFNLNLRGDISQRKNDRLAVSAIGFASTAEPLLYLAGKYKPSSKPGGSTTESNSVAFIGSMNYSYDMKYNFDFSYNLSGTSNFGSDNPYQTFYSFGLGWNISREKFMKDVTWVDQLNLSSNFGLTGNQNAGNFGSRSTYILDNMPTFFGESYMLNGLGNPNLEWTKTYNLSYILSGRFLKNRLSVSLSGYRNETNPLIVAIPLPLSVGLPAGVPKNIGKLTSTGLELITDVRLLNNKKWMVSLGVNAPVLYKSEYSGLGSSLDKFNDIARNNNALQRYKDGTSPDDVWAVRSLGIGQARGFEVFLDKDGNYTYQFDRNNEVIVGNSRPVTQGNVNLSVRYKRFNVSVYSRYVVQEMKFNTALYNKVENISSSGIEYNQDKRALYVRWKEMGDDASFLGIANSTLGMSSRFLQKENALFVDAINFNYDLLDQYSTGLKEKIKNKLGLQSLNFGITTSNIFKFQFSNVRMEKGLDYPFQRSATLNMSLTF